MALVALLGCESPPAESTKGAPTTSAQVATAKPSALSTRRSRAQADDRGDEVGCLSRRLKGVLKHIDQGALSKNTRAAVWEKYKSRIPEDQQESVKADLDANWHREFNDVRRWTEDIEREEKSKLCRMSISSANVDGNTAKVRLTMSDGDFEEFTVQQTGGVWEVTGLWRSAWDKKMSEPPPRKK